MNAHDSKIRDRARDTGSQFAAKIPRRPREKVPPHYRMAVKLARMPHLSYAEPRHPLTCLMSANKKSPILLEFTGTDQQDKHDRAPYEAVNFI